ncbi:hypothetical protein [Lentzea californiensis]|uniref:hypothetical protein n=1 Tax=Lentzea californiensis TaxID=438851 RepID=UPI002164DCDB|nr:hypothetical protein [Lentzea californiensis]MCR3746503.1 hypothetical protein [Lentzea californiensis]
MATTETETDRAWAPQACTLPTARQPLRIAEFGALFATALTGVHRAGGTSLRLELEAGAEVEATARDLIAGESRCCSFFAFTFSHAEDVLHLDVEVPPAHADVLDGLEAHARSRMSGADT